MKQIIAALLVIFTYTQVQAQWTMENGLGFLIGPRQEQKVNVVSSFDSTICTYKVSTLGISGFIYPKYHLSQENTSSTSRSKSNSRGRTSTSRTRSSSSSNDKPYSLSIGAPILLGASFGGNGASLMYSLGTVCALNFGTCKINSEAPVGAYLGAGLGIANCNQYSFDQNVTYETGFNSKYKIAQSTSTIRPTTLGFGPLLQAGFEIASRNKGRNYGANLSYQLAVNRSGMNYLQLGLQLPMGGGYY